MELYPSIGTIISTEPVYVFDKLDGSNIRAEWSRKSGFTKYGTRHRLLDRNEPMLGEAVELFEDNYAEELGKIFKDARYERATAFLEFYGQSSFAGFHQQEQHEVKLFDIHVYKKGVLSPKEFLKLVDDKVQTVNLLHHGKFDHEMYRDVRESNLEGMTFEGVVAKGDRDKRNRPVMFKLKSYAWLQRLKSKYGEDSEMYRKLV
jgi:ATP-dependent RNA circularization protein (DNA/RNA ligase family)